MLKRLLLITGLAGMALPALALPSVAGAAARPAMTHKDTLVVNITTTGTTTWGTVTVHYMWRGKMRKVTPCSKASCTYHTPHMARLHLRETPTSSATWPFKNWKLRNGHALSTHHGSKLVFEIMGKKATITANYVLKM